MENTTGTAKTVWKFPLVLEDTCALMMPVGAKILTVQAQAGWPCLWAIVNPDAPQEARLFALVGTGHSVPEWELDYIGTVQIEPGLVFHLFERKWK